MTTTYRALGPDRRSRTIDKVDLGEETNDEDWEVTDNEVKALHEGFHEIDVYQIWCLSSARNCPR